MLRTAFLIDGFNFYHSAKEASTDLNLHGSGTLWLDLPGLLHSYLPVIRTGLDKKVQLKEIHYFSALATHLGQQKVVRHQNYIRCLEASNVLVELGRFKPKDVWCPKCKQANKHWEEKESDVAISVRLAHIALQRQCDVAVLVTGDTDLAPAMRMVRHIVPDFKIVSAFPYKRKNKELANLADYSFNMSKENYSKHQLADPFVLPDGSLISKPAHW